MKKILTKIQPVTVGLIVGSLLLALLSFIPLANKCSNPESYADTIASLDAKQNTVLELSAIAVATSTTISLAPGDAGSPLANKLMDLSTIFLGVLSIIIFEKYLVTIFGYAAFRWLIPIGLICIIIYLITRKQFLRTLATKLIVLGISLVLIIPVSEKISNIISTTYEASSEIVEQKAKQDLEVEEAEKSFWDKITDGFNDIKESAESKFNGLIEMIAILIVTNCLIPIMVVIAFIWLFKIIVGIDIHIPRIKG